MSCLRLSGRIIALFIVLIFVTVTPVFILAYNAQQSAIEGDFLDELFEDTELFEEAIPEIAEDLARDVPDEFETRNMPIARFDAQDWEDVIYAVAPPESMQAWAQDGVAGFRQWTRGDGRFMDDVTLPFGEMRDNIINDPEQTVLRTLTQAQPECSGGQEPLGGANNLIPQCRPPESQIQAFYQRLGERWREQPRQVWNQLWPDDLARYPDDITLAEFIEKESGEDWRETRADLRASRWLFRMAQWLLVLCVSGQCLVALSLVALFAARNWREALQWFGTPLVIAGVFTLLLALPFFIGGEIGTWFIPDKEVPVGVQAVAKDAARAFVRDLWPSMAWQGGVLVLIGLGLWVLSFFAPGKDDWADAPVAPEPAGVEIEEAPEVEEVEAVGDEEPSSDAPDEDVAEPEDV